MSRRLDLGRLFGVPFEIDASWFVILALVTWTLSRGYFPLYLHSLYGTSHLLYWVMGFVAAVLLFVCVLLHELSHAVVARAHGIPVRRITLFIFGGVAQIAHDPTRPLVELRVALAGPLVSLALAGLCAWLKPLLLVRVAAAADSARLLAEVLLIGGAICGYLAMVNVALVVFNLLPGFPLDGGRVLRAVLWGWWGDLRKATRIASAVGNGLGLGLLAIGLLSMAQGRWINGVWSVLLGFYLRDAARASYAQVVARPPLVEPH